jgi:hypothetical protein
MCPATMKPLRENHRAEYIRTCLICQFADAAKRSIEAFRNLNDFASTEGSEKSLEGKEHIVVVIAMVIFQAERPVLSQGESLPHKPTKIV